MAGILDWEETAELTLDIAMKDLKLAVSEDTVYVGKRDGHLNVSFDKGNTWIDLTPALPFPVKVFKEIVVAGTSVFCSNRHWYNYNRGWKKLEHSYRCRRYEPDYGILNF